MASAPVHAVLREIGRRIKAARTAADLTQEDAAARSAIDYKRWQRIESGGINVTVRTLVRVAETLDCSVWQLLSPPPSRNRRAR